MDVPAGLSWWRARPGGAEWLDALPALAAACAERWDLRLGHPFEPATISLVVPAERRDGTRAVLKINFPEAESEHEPAALAHWDGDGAARLLAADPGRAALLIERLDPARRLWSLPEPLATTTAAGVLRRLWSTPPAPTAPFPRLEDAVEEWAVAAARRPPTQPRLLDLAAGLSRELLACPGEPVVLHQDFTAATCCSTRPVGGWQSTRSRWSASGRSTALRWCATAARSCCAIPIPLARIRRRLGQLSRARLDRDRIRGWAVVHAVAWGGDTGPGWDTAMVACAGWLADA